MFHYTGIANEASLAEYRPALFGVCFAEYESSITVVSIKKIQLKHLHIKFICFCSFWLSYSVPESDLALLDPDPAVSERVPRLIVLASMAKDVRP